MLPKEKKKQDRNGEMCSDRLLKHKEVVFGTSIEWNY